MVKRQQMGRKSELLKRNEENPSKANTWIEINGDAESTCVENIGL